MLAPMAGVTDAPLRCIAMEYGAGAAIGEMVASRELVAASADAVLKARGVRRGPNIVQLAGCEADSLAEAARLAESGGADIVDINMGCPAKRVINGWAGAALMRNLDHAEKLIRAVIAAVSVPVTVKMRLGWDERDLNAPELARRSEAAGVAAITVHGRTRSQFYNGAANWAEVARVKAAISVPVIVNGDIDSAESARRALSDSGADAVMIGRAAIGRPWLVGQVARSLADPAANGAAPGIEEFRMLVLRHYNESLAHHGAATGGRIVRKHLAAYADELARRQPVDVSVRSIMLRSNDPCEVRDAIHQLFDGKADRRAA